LSRRKWLLAVLSEHGEGGVDVAALLQGLHEGQTPGGVPAGHAVHEGAVGLEEGEGVVQVVG